MTWLGAAGYPDVHPPLFYLLLGAWQKLGSSEAWLRTLPVLLGLFSLGLCLRLPGMTRTGWVLLAFSFAELQQSRELRMYSLLEFLAVVHVWALLGRRWYWAGLSLLAACYTHLFGLFLFPLGWLMAPRRWLGVQIVVLGLWLPWAVPHYLAQQDHPLGLRPAPGLAVGLEAVGRLAAGRVAAVGDRFSLLLGAGILGLLVWHLGKGPRCPAWVYAWALGPGCVLWTLSAFTPIHLFEFKYLIWTWPAWCLWLGRMQVAVGVSLAGVNLALALPWLLWPQRFQADWRAVAGLLKASQQDVCVHPSMMGAPLLYYGLGPPRLKFVDEFSQLAPGGAMIWVSTPNHPFVASQGLLRGVSRYWRLERRERFDCQLPSGVVEVTFWRWEKQAP